MKCDRCGKEFPDTELYCDRCGKAVFPEYMDEDDIWAYYKTDEELEEILKAEQEGKPIAPKKALKTEKKPLIRKVSEEIISEDAAPEETVLEEMIPEKVVPEEVASEETAEEEDSEENTETEAEIFKEENLSEEEDLFEDDEEEEDDEIPLTPQKKKERRKIGLLITLILLLCLGIGIAIGMKRMKDLDRQEKEYYEELHKETVDQSASNEKEQKEMSENSVQEDSQPETPKQEYFQLVNPDEIDFSQYQKVIPVNTEANSIKQSDSSDYSAKSAVDGDVNTSWQENEEGTGEATGIKLSFDGNHKIRYIVLNLGNWRSEQLWEYNARPKTLTMQVGDSQTKEVEFSDEMKRFCLSFDEPLDASYISMYIASSYEGSRWNDNCISEVEIYE